MSKDANSFGHDKALAWESRGFVYTKRGCIVSTHPLQLTSRNAFSKLYKPLFMYIIFVK